MSSDLIDTHIRNFKAEYIFDMKTEEEKEKYQVVKEFDGFTLTTMDYNKVATPLIEGLEDCSKGFIKTPYKGRKPGDR